MNRIKETVIMEGMALAMLAGVVAAAPAVKADRARLTYRDSGLYCNLNFWMSHKPEDDGVTNQLSAERAAGSESPWSFYVVQFNGPVSPEQAQLIEQMAANGKKVILRMDIGRMDPSPKVDELERRLVDLLKGLDPDWLYAIVLGEEQVFWNGWLDSSSDGVVPAVQTAMACLARLPVVDTHGSS